MRRSGIAGARSASLIGPNSLDTAYVAERNGMAPLSPDNTARYKVFYVTNAKAHTQEIRTNVVSPSALGTLVDAYYTALNTKIYGTTITEVQFASTGSNVFNPVTTGIEGNVYSSGSGIPGEVPYYFDFIGRSTGGRRMRFAQFGAKALGSDYRYIAGEDSDLDNALAVIVGAGSAWVAIDGIKPTMKTYINAGVNAYWQRKVRP